MKSRKDIIVEKCHFHCLTMMSWIEIKKYKSFFPSLALLLFLKLRRIIKYYN